MALSFIILTTIFLTALATFSLLAEVIRVSTYYALVLLGAGFLTEKRFRRYLFAALGALFYSNWGMVAVLIAMLSGIAALEMGRIIAAHIQQFGATIQNEASASFGRESLLTAFIVGLTLGFVWVPCAGPALAFALTLIREEPGAYSVFLLSAYVIGAAIPLLLIGYGGQYAVKTVRSFSRYTDTVKRIAGLLLILTAFGIHYHFFEKVQLWVLDSVPLASLEERLQGRWVPMDAFDAILGEKTPRTQAPIVRTPALPKITRAPEFQGLGPWHNSQPFTLASLKGKVVLVDFWTYSCINCIRTLPHIQGYFEKFKDTPFVLIGIHSPEFAFEKLEKNVADAITRHGLTYPTAQDNNFETWRAFANRYWPAKYLIDADGYIRYTHFGEGAYEETDEAIQSLLMEIGVQTEGSEGTEGNESNEGRREQTPETYLGERSWPALGNGSRTPTDEETLYEAREEMELHKYYLVGEWQMRDQERQVLLSPEGEIRMKFLGSEINLVLGLEEGAKSIEADIEVDGELAKTITIDMNDLFNLFTGEYGEHEMILRIHGAGVAGYAFTFGS
jgi:cytochrome c biogenesis protein CcdA/thiol-disulfide isomerase/thioredoxin